MIFGPTPGPLDDDGLLDAYPWPAEGTWLRAMMVTTLDGASAGPDGLSGSISGGVDKQVFDSVRRLADVVLVGAATIRAEGYGAMTAKPADAQRRKGQLPAPVIAIVSPSLDLPWDSALFTESTERPIVLTVADAPEERLTRARLAAEVVQAPELTPTWMVQALVERGLRRIVCEGGASLLESVVRAGLLDEADITLSPSFAGHGHSKQSDGLDEIVGLQLVHVLTAEGFLMNRYVR